MRTEPGTIRQFRAAEPVRPARNPHASLVILRLVAVLALGVCLRLEAAVATSATATMELDENLISTGTSLSASASVDGGAVMVHHLRARSSGAQIGLLGGVWSVAPAGNHAPVVSDSAVSTTSASLALAISASDADGDALIYDVGTPSTGTVSGLAQATGLFTWTPPVGFVGAATIPVSAGDGWAVGTGTITVTVVTSAVIVSPAGPLTVREDGTQASVTVRLNAPPTATATIPVQSSNPSEFTTSVSSLVFTASDWNQPQTILVTGVRDNIVDGDRTSTLQLLPITGGGNFNGIDGSDVSVVVIDTDRASFSASPASVVVNETGTSAQVTVRLATPPSTAVTISAGSSNVGKATVSPVSQTLAPSAWTTPLVFTITGVDNLIADGNVQFNITFVASGDTAYAAQQPVTVSGICLDNDGKTLLVNQGGTTLSVAEGSTTPATWSISLSQPPSAPVTVTLTPDAYLTVTPATVTFTSANWSTSQTISAQAVDDQIEQGVHNGTVTHTWTSADTGYVSVGTGVVMTVAVTDNDTSAIIATPVSGLATTQVGGTASFTVQLATQPAGLVSVPLTSSDLTQGTVSPASLTFDATTWNTPQTVTITGANNGRFNGDVAYQIQVGGAFSSDAFYQGLAGTPVQVVNRGVDFPPTLNPLTDLSVAEDSGQTTVALSGISAGQPGENQTVSVTASSSDPSLTGAVTVSYASPSATGSLSLTPQANANGTATITVIASDGTQTVTRTFVLTVTPVNDPPVVVRSTPLVVAYHGSASLLPLQSSPTAPGQFAVSDVETPTASLLIRVVAKPNFGDLELLNPVSGAPATLGNGSVVTGADLAAGRVRYTHTDPSPTPAINDAAQLQVDDGQGGTAAGVLAIQIDTSVPRIDLPGSRLAYTEGDPALALGSTALVLSGTSPSFAGGSLTATIAAGAGPGDRLSVVPVGNGAGQIGLAGTQVSYGGTVFASLSGGTSGTPLIVTFTGATDVTMVQALVRCLAYDNSGRNPGASDREVACVVIDQAGKSNPSAQRTIGVTPVNDAPTVAGASLLAVAGSAIQGAVIGTDPEGATITYAVATPPSKGALTAFNTATGAFTYLAGSSQSGQDVFSVTVSDGTLMSAAATVTIDITGGASTVRPWIFSRPPLVAQAGDLLQWTATADVSELTGPILTWSLVGAPAGMTQVAGAGGLDAGMSWAIPINASGWYRFTVVATDSVSRTAAVQHVALFIQALPGGGG